MSDNELKDAARSTINLWLKAILILFAIGSVGLLADTAFKTINPEGHARVQEKKAAAALAKKQSEVLVEQTKFAEIEAERQNGMHCLSSWDGSNRDLVRKIKPNLRNPDSFEHIETSIYGNDGGEHGLWMTYRAQNGFGGMNVERVYARIDHESCNALRYGNDTGI